MKTSILIVMKHSYGQLGFPDIVEVKDGGQCDIEEEAAKYNNPPFCNDGYKAVIKQVRINLG